MTRLLKVLLRVFSLSMLIGAAVAVASTLAICATPSRRKSAWDMLNCDGCGDGPTDPTLERAIDEGALAAKG